jgi:hypothetical protein
MPDDDHPPEMRSGYSDYDKFDDPEERTRHGSMVQTSSDLARHAEYVGIGQRGSSHEQSIKHRIRQPGKPPHHTTKGHQSGFR